MGVEGLRANKKTVRTSARVVSLFAIFSIWISSSSVRAEIIGLPEFSCEKKKITMNPNQLQNENLLQSIMLSWSTMNPNQLQNENLLQSIMLSWSISNILCIQIHYLKLKLLATDNHQGEQDFTFFQNKKNIWELTSPCGFALNNWESFSCGVKNSCHSMTSISLEMENTKLLRITSIIHCNK